MGPSATVMEAGQNSGQKQQEEEGRVGEQMELYHSMYSMSVHVFAYVQLACKDVLTL